MPTCKGTDLRQQPITLLFGPVLSATSQGAPWHVKRGQDSPGELAGCGGGAVQRGGGGIRGVHEHLVRALYVAACSNRRDGLSTSMQGSHLFPLLTSSTGKSQDGELVKLLLRLGDQVISDRGYGNTATGAIQRSCACKAADGKQTSEGLTSYNSREFVQVTRCAS